MVRVIVIGGGIAGTAAALGLHKAGFDVSVYEAYPDGAEDIGAFLTLASNGMRALAALGASVAVTAIGYPLTTLRVLDGSGAEVANAPLGESGDPLLRYRCLRRGELNAALQAEVARRGISIRHGARLASVEEGPSAVTAHFTGGATATGDLLVGADGLRSTVRRLIAPGAEPLHAGQRVFYGYADHAAPAGAPGTITMVRGGAAAFGCAMSPAGETYWFARVAGEPPAADEIAQSTPTRWREPLVELLRKDATPAAGIVAATGDRIMVTGATEMPLGMPWRSGRVLIVGDAAHAASPATGQGASMALEDAVVLAKALRDTPDTGSALALYETLRRPRVEYNIAASGRISRAATAPPGPARGQAARRPGDDELIRHLEWDADIRTGCAHGGGGG
ncbi:FAD-dependent oxidoreductase [Streptomyces montanisoli]|uniref:FAD-dependent monooxygenase n=1 Tax=Streptomyces montanisoli TaxID=2798581 RepID=A0A940ME30_9ACTN|nr:NAD(P)/FAD-dependent oxidoreductase [Streptomyces montanisoli]MBP0458300.1 FAD-dependent monooxygenase [Streptomyces montanisoli]